MIYMKHTFSQTFTINFYRNNPSLPLYSLALLLISTTSNIKKVHRTVFELEASKAVIKGIFSRSYCCYGNLSCYEKNYNVSPMFEQLFDTTIVALNDKVWL